MSSRKKKRRGKAGRKRSRSGSAEGRGRGNETVEGPDSPRRRQAIVRGFLLLCLLGGGILLLVYRPWASSPEEAPEPWEYDEVRDRHWHPGHGHWHDGPPPEQVGSRRPEVDLPFPWEYDPVNDRYWHPGHAHWHSGRPPPPEER